MKRFPTIVNLSFLFLMATNDNRCHISLYGGDGHLSTISSRQKKRRLCMGVNKALNCT